jgi:hypothetical protein
LVVTPSLAAPSQAGVRPCTPGYSYSGFAGRQGASGVAATISARAPAAVQTGHAAAWVGVGGSHQGPNGVSEWLQAGIAAFPGVGLRVYVEGVSRGGRRRFTDLGRASVRRQYSVRVVETGRDVWQAFVDGRAAGKPAYLPTTGGSWRPVVTAESWTAGRAACNRYAYSFEGVSVLGAGRWVTLGDAERLGAGVSGSGAGFSVIG